MGGGAVEIQREDVCGGGGGSSTWVGEVPTACVARGVSARLASCCGAPAVWADSTPRAAHCVRRVWRGVSSRVVARVMFVFALRACFSIFVSFSYAKLVCSS